MHPHTFIDRHLYSLRRGMHILLLWNTNTHIHKNTQISMRKTSTNHTNSSTRIQLNALQTEFYTNLIGSTFLVVLALPSFILSRNWLLSSSFLSLVSFNFKLHLLGNFRCPKVTKKTAVKIHRFCEKSKNDFLTIELCFSRVMLQCPLVILGKVPSYTKFTT